MQKRRRDFFKITAAGATSLVLARSTRAFAAWPPSGTVNLNPNIGNMRVVGLVDKAMIPTTPKSTSFADENAAVDSARVAANLDLMAMALAQKCKADDAWRAIFRSSKPWSSTVVALKINTAEPKNMARVAVVDKLCRVLGGFGVPAANIMLYDAQGSAYTYSSYCSKTDATKIPAVVDSGGMGGKIEVPLPDGTTAMCAKKIADGTVDILINLPSNKGHEAFGGATLSLKNHFGTFTPNHFCPPSDAGNFCSNPDITKFYNYIFNISKSDAIIGGDPARQQLCLVDSLLANKLTNTGDPESMPCYLVMGTFGPAVDYLTIKKVREGIMGATHNAALVNQYMTQFGYTTNDPQWVQVDPAAGPPTSCDSTGSGGASGSGGSSSPSQGGGAGSGGAKASGGVTGSGTSSTGQGGGAGSGGAKASGGMVGSGGNTGAGGSGAGGNGPGGSGSAGTSAVPVGGITSAGSGGGFGGAGSGGASGSGGANTATSRGTESTGRKGCGCDLGGIVGGVERWGSWFAIGAVAAGQLRRLILRRETVSAPSRPNAQAGASESDDHKESS